MAKRFVEWILEEDVPDISWDIGQLQDRSPKVGSHPVPNVFRIVANGVVSEESVFESVTGGFGLLVALLVILSSPLLMLGSKSFSSTPKCLASSSSVLEPEDEQSFRIFTFVNTSSPIHK